MVLQNSHETRIAPSLITPQQNPTTVGNRLHTLPRSQTKLPTAAQQGTYIHSNTPNSKQSRNTKHPKIQLQKTSRTLPAATFVTPLPKPTTATGVSRLNIVLSPTCRNHLVSRTSPPHADQTPSQHSGRNYLAIIIVTPAKDRPTA